MLVRIVHMCSMHIIPCHFKTIINLNLHKKILVSALLKNASENDYKTTRAHSTVN